MVFVNERVDFLGIVAVILSHVSRGRAGGSLEGSVLGQHVVVVEEHKGDLPRGPHIHQPLALGLVVELRAHPLAAVQFLQARRVVADVPEFGVFDTNPPALLVDRGHGQQVAQLSHGFGLAALGFGQQGVGEGALVDAHFFLQVSVKRQLVLLFDEVGRGLEPGLCFVVFHDAGVVKLLFVPARHGRGAAREGLGQGVLAVPPVG